jgi:hypothetical protein
MRLFGRPPVEKDWSWRLRLTGRCRSCGRSFMWHTTKQIDRCLDAPLKLRPTRQGEIRMLEGWWKQR